MTICTICRRLSRTRPIGDPLYNARVCIGWIPCLTYWLSQLDGHDSDRVLAYVLALVTHTDVNVGRCHYCGDMVYTAQPRVHTHDDTTKLVLHMSCYIQRLSEKLMEPL
jgi:hypothetical protein